MGAPDRKPLFRTVEVDETFIPFCTSVRSVDRDTNLLTVVGAVERVENGAIGRIRLEHKGKTAGGSGTVH